MKKPLRFPVRLGWLSFLLFAAAALAQQPSQPPPSVEDLKLRFEEKLAAYQKPIVDLQAKYEASLKLFEGETRSKGDLQNLLQVQMEIESFRNSNYSNPEAYLKMPKLGELRSAYLKSYWEIQDKNQREKLELHKLYLKRMVDIQVASTKAGRLDEAIFAEAATVQAKSSLAKVEALSRWRGRGAFERNLIWELRTREDLVPHGDVTMDPAAGPLKISAMARDNIWFKSRETFRPPLRLVARACSDSLDVRLVFGAGVIAIFNWQARPDELRIQDPISGGAGIGIAGKGDIGTNEMKDLEVRVTANRISVYVDGALRGSRDGDFSQAQGPIGIGPAFGSVVSVEAMAVFGE